MNGVCVFFFFRQKTAYEIRKGDWSSDVCSSDLPKPPPRPGPMPIRAVTRDPVRSEERRVGKSVLPCVDLGGRRIIKKKKKKKRKKYKEYVKDYSINIK